MKYVTSDCIRLTCGKSKTLSLQQPTANGDQHKAEEEVPQNICVQPGVCLSVCLSLNGIGEYWFSSKVSFLCCFSVLSLCLSEKSFRECVLSRFFLFHLLWLSVMQLRHYLFIGTLNPMLHRLTEDEPSLGKWSQNMS